MAEGRRIAYSTCGLIVDPLPSKTHTMHFLFFPALASVIWIGGGSVGAILLVNVVVIWIRR
jgi:hypothetical protein